MQRRTLFTSLVAGVIITAVLGVASAGVIGFKDVPEGHWASSAVGRLSQLGILEGFPDGTFRGDEPVSRFQAAAIVTRVLEKTAVPPASLTNWKWTVPGPINPALPDHLMLDLGGGKEFFFLHFDQPVTDVANPFDPEFLNQHLMYVGLAQRGRFFKEDQPNQAYVHFHKFQAPSVDAGHGGEAGDAGLWFVHAAVKELQMPWGKVEPSVDFQMMPTSAPGQGNAAMANSVTDFKFSAAAKKLISPAMPDHKLLDIGGGRLIFLHYDRPADQPGAQLMYVGDAIRGRFSEEERPRIPGYTHFHKLFVDAPTAEAGHGGNPGDEGYWFRHIAVREMQMPWGKVTPGVDFKFMPTPVSFLNH